MQRKLAAIMAADIVGYSRLMAENETSTYAGLRSVFDDLIDPTVARYGGTNFKTTGDGFLAMFPSVNAAVDAALAIQHGFDEGPFKLRIGINLGDVIEDCGDVFGDGVNVAARLEAMTEPGQIFVSGAVVMAAERNRGDRFARVGRRRAKNIPELLEVYRVRRPGSPWSVWRQVPHVLRGTAARWSYGVAALSVRSHRYPDRAHPARRDGRPPPESAVSRPVPRRSKAVGCGDAFRYHDRRRGAVLHLRTD